MLIRINDLYRDFHVPVAGPGDRHYGGEGWVNTPCPFCSGNPGNHLGYCVDPASRFAGRFVCHRCGGKGTLRALSRLLRVEDEGRLWAIMAKYGSVTPRAALAPTRKAKVLRTVDLPPLTRRLGEVPGAVRYLRGRGFDPEEIERLWRVGATGPGSVVKGKSGSLDMSYRIIIPVLLNGRVVTYQGRDWTGKSPRKYLACLPELEGWPIKETLYGLDEAGDSQEVALMEGVTDVWRWGPGAVACFGVKHRPEQVRLLARRFDRVLVAFDPEGGAKVQSRRILRELKELGVEVRRLLLPKGKDPGDMAREDLLRLARS